MKDELSVMRALLFSAVFILNWCSGFSRLDILDDLVKSGQCVGGRCVMVLPANESHRRDDELEALTVDISGTQDTFKLSLALTLPLFF